MEVHQIKRCLAQMIVLAGPGVLISTFCLGSALKFTFPYNWSWKTSLLLGGLLSATDPVAVVALLKDLGASKKLSTIIEGESLMNDGTAIVVYQLFYQMVLGKSFNWTAIIKFLTKVSLGAVGIGLAFGIISTLWLGVIFMLTLIVNGSTTQFILSLLHMDELSAAKRRILGYTKYEMLNKALEAFGELGDDEELGPADWPTVKRYITSLNNLEGESVQPYGASEDDDNNLNLANLNDIRIRMLNGVQAAYWGMLDEGRITQTTANLLMQSVDEALDLVSHELCDWNGLKTNVKFPSYYKLLQGFVPQKLALYFTVERLESACYICAAFLRAHRMARWQLHDFLGESDVASIVIKESEAEGQEARKFLEEVRVAFPQVLRVVKTRQVTYSVLNHLIDYIQNCEKIGLLEEKEMLHLHDAVQTDLKKLLRNPPLVKIPKMSDLISVHPLFGALPSSVSAPLQGSTQETVKLCGVTLYKEGFKPKGIWLISNGVVKWTSKSIKNKHSLHPAFTHGSTLGLYEVLSGKSNICNMITDSVVLCFFVESEKILSVLSLDPSLEDFLWQESAIVLVKLLLPQIFEKMALQDLRALVSERSIMKLYIRGETIEVPQHSIGFLLEGFIKIQGAEELVASPAALLPSHGSLIFETLESSGITGASFSHQGSCYQVETRARVIIFDMAAFEGDSTLQRSSWISPAADRPHRSLGREPRRLMSWPENFYNLKQHNQIREGIDQQANSLSARAMQLSIYGSMVNTKWCTRSSWRRGLVKPSHSLSYPTVPSYKDRRLLSVKSKGGITARKNLGENKFTGNRQVKYPRGSHPVDDSSDESGPEDEVVVSIDSPSRLSFR
ncbi:hypothetical protein I3760_05G156300 [Carya illinoinensis]|nr:hypothetical protein I3760_05G156300 [Carya illinoinensis]